MSGWRKIERDGSSGWLAWMRWVRACERWHVSELFFLARNSLELVSLGWVEWVGVEDGVRGRAVSRYRAKAQKPVS